MLLSSLAQVSVPGALKARPAAPPKQAPAAGRTPHEPHKKRRIGMSPAAHLTPGTGAGTPASSSKLAAFLLDIGT